MDFKREEIMDHGKNRSGLKAKVLFLLISMAWIYSCEKYSFTPQSVDPDAQWSFKNDIQPVFTSNCIKCHGGSKTPDLREGKSYQVLTKGGYVNLPAETSRLYSTMKGADHISHTTEPERLKVLYWITQGAQNN